MGIHFYICPLFYAVLYMVFRYGHSVTYWCLYGLGDCYLWNSTNLHV